MGAAKASLSTINPADIPRHNFLKSALFTRYDRRFNRVDPDAIPTLSAGGLKGKILASDDWQPPMLLLEFTGSDGRSLRLCDFASAGIGGSPYRSWLTVEGVTPAEFSPMNTLRSRRADLG
jgi:hypothetical protein